MNRIMTLATAGLLLLAPISALSQYDDGYDIELYDEDGNYSYGEVDSRGNIDLYDEDGNYSYGEAD